MVQRKAADKLGIKADTNNCIKSEKRFAVSKTSSSQGQDARTKGGAELKKIMKKSRSIKRPDFDTLQMSSAMRQGAKAKAEKPKPKPASYLSVAVVTPQKPPRVKTPETPPNYMKSTSCSTARKEHRQVSPSQKNSISSKLSSGSAHKSGRSLTKTPSLRPVRTLTKTSGNKAGRTSMKKNSGVALYADQHVRKDTCSSTLKDSKFPPYVALQPGGTEAEGFSIMKVCPYTYCSLNGHHHAQLPPLKSFLAAKRQAIKTQKIMRLESLSPARRKPYEVPKKDIDTGQVVFEDSFDSKISRSNSEEGLDFFVEIYTPPSEISTESMGRNTDDVLEEGGDGDLRGIENTSYLAEDGDGTEVGNGGGRYAESLPDDPAYSAMSFEDNINRDTDFVMEDIDASMFLLEYNQMENIEDSCLENFLTGYESGESEIDDSISETHRMEWEEGEFVDTCLTDTPIVANEEIEQLVSLKDFKEPELHGDDVASNCDENALAGDELQFDQGESEYLDDQFEAMDHNLEAVLSGVMNVEEFNEEVIQKSEEVSEQKNVENEKDELIAIGTSSDAVEHEQEDISSESETKLVPEDPDSTADLYEPEHEERQLENEVFESINFETDQGVGSSENLSLSDILPVSAVNIDDGPKEAEDTEDEAEAEAKRQNNNRSVFSDENTSTECYNLKSFEKSSNGVAEIVEDDVAKAEKTRTVNECSSNQECSEDCIKFNKHTRCKKKTEDSDETREFNPRGPNFLPLEPEPNPETVDLRHQMMDERKNSEEWMVDYALRRAVNKLAPARKRKVALLVEAFETVLPVPKYAIRIPHTPTGFAQSRYMQACN